MIAKHTPANGAGHDYPITWHPIEMIALRHFKESVSYGTHSPYVKERLSNRAIQDKITPQDWKGLVLCWGLLSRYNG